ncbi:multicopper oxidase family protein [Aeromicrobium sp. CF4.19]|uniref:multicopper oxidase family protein n=1 Tax=Aeromicrobium sp. CF4.19 TaxID=3373082 RepID=UPI003EE61BB9
MARRRRTLRILINLAVLAVLGLVAVGVWVGVSFLNAGVDTVGEVEFDRPLAIPPLADSRVEDGRRIFELEMAEGRTDLGRGEDTPTWGFNGSMLGPTLRAERGEQVEVAVTNALGEDTTVHWHGMHLPAVMDGGPHQMVAPGETWRPTWLIDQPAATLWYHPHPHGETAQHVYRGLAGMFILDDPAEQVVQEQLPHEYGVDDVPVVVQDKNFDGAELDTSSSVFSSAGLLGDTVLVNGTPGPYLEVTTERVRLRVLNGSTARTYRFVLSDDRPFDVIASDGGLLPEPVELGELMLSPGERAEIVVELEPGEDVVLRSEAPGNAVGGRFQGGDDRLDVLQLRAADVLEPSPAVPDRLADAPDLDADDVEQTRDFRLAGVTINGRVMDMSRIDHAVEVGTVERWRVHNADGQGHNFHVHDVQFAVESIDGRPPPPHLRGWKDTVFMPPGVRTDLVMRFSDHTDPDVPYMFHCHLLRHEDQGMMGQFVVVDPGQSTGSPPTSAHDH